MFIIYAEYREVPTPLYYTLDEVLAIRLVELLEGHPHDYDRIRYLPIVEFRRLHRNRPNPFIVKYYGDGQVERPDWISFIKLSSDEVNHETSREREGGILPTSTIDADSDHDSDDDIKQQRKDAIESFRSRLRRRSGGRPLSRNH